MSLDLRRHGPVLLWAVILLVSCGLQTFTALDDARYAGKAMSPAVAVAQEATSHAMWALLLPAIYWLHRRAPLHRSLRNLALHALATVPVSLAHVAGMGLLRNLVALALDWPYRYSFAFAQFLYEFRKDVMTYVIFSGALVAFDYLFARAAPANAAAAPPPAATADPIAADPVSAPLARFAVRKRDREVLVSAEEIDWIEAAGNYAILHVGTERHEIRSSMARLEGELDPARFLRVHKSAIVNIARVREVEPWVSGDYRIRLQDGTVVPLSRRFRARFAASVPVRS